MCVRSSTGDIRKELLALCSKNIVISVEDCFEILVSMKALFSASGLRQNFEMARSGGVVDRDFPIFAHGVIDISHGNTTSYRS